MQEFTFRTNEGYEYRPFSDGRLVGFIVTAPNGARQALLLSPSHETDDGFASVSVMQAHIETDADLDPRSDTYLATADEVAFTDLFDAEITADTLARADLKTMAIGAEPTPAEIQLRAAEYADRIWLDRVGLKGRNCIEIEERRNHEGNVLDVARIVRWAHLYGVTAGIERTDGNTSLVTIGGRVTVGPGWYEGTARNRRAYVANDEAYLTTDDPAVSVPARWTELETAWMAINMLAGKPLFTFADDGSRRPAKAEPVGPPITA